MKILLASIGTRGDMEPFLAIGEILKKRGHDVICVFPEQFRHLAEDSGMRFTSLGREFIDTLESDVGKLVMGGGGSKWKKLKGYIELSKIGQKINKEMVEKQKNIIKEEQPDRIVYHTKAIYPLIWETKNKGKSMCVSPVPYLHYVKGHTQ